MPFTFSVGGGVHRRMTEVDVRCECLTATGGAEGAGIKHKCEFQSFHSYLVLQLEFTVIAPTIMCKCILINAVLPSSS